MLLKMNIVLIALLMSLKISAQGKRPLDKSISKTKQATSIFSGDFEGIHNGKTINITLTSNGTSLFGTLLMNGEKAKVIGMVKSTSANGKIIEDLSGKTYAFTAERKGSDLYFNITFPEYNNQVIKLNLQKINLANQVLTNKSREPKLIGTWRNTEVISSGSGQFYSSFSTDYFVKFNTDGTALIWSGKSAGGTKDVTIDANGKGNVQKMEWYTVGKNLYLVNPQNKQQSAINFYAEPNRIMLTQNNRNKVYQRVN